MDIEQIEETKTWQLYEKGRNYHRMMNYYTDTDRNYRFYNGNQWEKAKLGDVEPVQKNFIRPIVRYKNGIIHDNLYAVVFSSQNFENKEFRKEAESICEMLNKKVAKIWENDKMDYKGRKVSKDSAINDEGLMYVDYDENNQSPLNEIVKKVDVYYGNENDEDIQAQPYIIIRKRMAVSNAREYAKNSGVSEGKLNLIIGDNDTFEESGESAKYELDNMVTVLTKMYKKDGTVHFSTCTRYCDIKEDSDTGLSLYPIAHFLWEEKEGSARGEGEVRYLIPNQIEVNRTEIRRVLTVKYQAYPQKIVNISKVVNPNAVQTVGGIIKANDQTVDDVRKIVSTLPPAQMSPDVKQLQEDLIQVTRELAGAGDIATGNINPESASGKAILAVQQASQAPLTEQKESYKNFIEDLAKIWLDMLIVYSKDGLTLEEEVTDEDGSTHIELRKIPQATLKELQASVKVDVTPKSPFDKYAQERSIENLFVQGMLNIQRLPELKIYRDLLDDDSVMPKQKLDEAIEKMEEEQRKIALIDAQARLMQQRASQFLNQDADAQASQINNIQNQEVGDL